MYLEGATPYPPQTIEWYTSRGYWENLTVSTDLLDRWATAFPNKIAVVDDKNQATFADLKQQSERFAIGLVKLGIKKNDRVIVQMPNRLESIVACFGVEKAGGVSVMAVPRHRKREILHFADLTEAVAWILPARDGKTEFRPLVEGVRAESKHLSHIVMLQDGEVLPPCAISMESLIDRVDLRFFREDFLHRFHHSPNDVFGLFHTSGTTGLPKLVPRTYNSFLSQMRSPTKKLDYAPEDVVLVPTPFGNMAALGGAVYRSIMYGSKLVMIPTFGAREILEAIEKHKVTKTYLVPTQVTDILDLPNLDRYDLRSLKTVVSTAAALPLATAMRARDFFGREVFSGDTFGMTEGVSIPLRPADQSCSASVPLVAPGGHFKVIDERERGLPPNTEGELAYKGPDLFTGYYKGDAENREAFTSDGYFKLGEMGKIDDLGFVVVTGRIKDIIKRGGETITPGEIETMLSLHPSIAAVAVVAMPDLRLGEKACAYVVLKPGSELTFEDMIGFLRSTGASVLLLPERLEVVPELPVSPLGKTDKKALRKDIKRKLVAQAPRSK